MNKYFTSTEVDRAIRLKFDSRDFLTEEQEEHLMDMHKLIIALSPKEAWMGDKVSLDMYEMSMLVGYL
jgi:hypothetical protein